eukprot:9452503-Karenia_brevis.AAC.1
MDMCNSPMMIYSFQSDVLYAPIPHFVINGLIDGLRPASTTLSRKMYDMYLARRQNIGMSANSSFISFTRRYRYDESVVGPVKVRERRSGVGRFASRTN